MLILVFWSSVLLGGYAYFGYPLLLLVIRAFRRWPVHREPIHPSVSAIVAVHDGAGRIAAKLQNLLEQDYPRELLEIVVADDASTDGTAELVARDFAPWGVKLVRLAERGGKEAAQNAALGCIQGEIVVFTDLGTMLDRSGVSTIVRSFADPSVGCVSSTDRFLTPDGRVVGEGLYVRYEMALRRLESDVGSIVGMSGSFFAARRAACVDFSADLPSDFRTVLGAVRHRLRAVCDEEAFGYYRDVIEASAEFQRKVRTVLRGMTAFFAELEMLNIFRYGLFSIQLLSHKLARWLVPFGMIAAGAASVPLAAGSVFFKVVTIAQLVFYALAAVGNWLPGQRFKRITTPIKYFVQVNVAILIAWLRFLRGDRAVTWSPTTR